MQSAKQQAAIEVDEGLLAAQQALQPHRQEGVGNQPGSGGRAVPAVEGIMGAPRNERAVRRRRAGVAGRVSVGAQ
jgi:hypothetical protein